MPPYAEVVERLQRMEDVVVTVMQEVVTLQEVVHDMTQTVKDMKHTVDDWTLVPIAVAVPTFDGPPASP
jgi:hypothetical protein